MNFEKIENDVDGTAVVFKGMVVDENEPIPIGKGSRDNEINPKDLMIDDWCINGLNQNMQCKNYHFNMDLYKQSIIPIELTGDILTANGFELYESELLTTWWKQKDTETQTELYNIEIDKYNDRDRFSVDIRNSSNDEYKAIITSVKYVHELQNVLRLMGFEKMADEFVV